MDFEVASGQGQLYVCPGETAPISHAVHLGRLQRLYPGCRDCPFNTETGQLSGRTVQRLERLREGAAAPLQRPYGGVRGVYLNQISREGAGEIAAAFAANLWSGVTRSVRTARRERVPEWSSPRLVIGYDSRTASPDIVIGVQSRLRLMCCDVIDLGLTSAPAISFAISRHSAAGGVFVTGSGCPPAWTGVDLFDHSGGPVDSEQITAIIDANAGTAARPTRHSGTHRFVPIDEEYGRRLRKHLRLLRPLRISVGIEDDVGVRRVTDLFGRRDEALIDVVRLPGRLRNLNDQDDSDIRRLAEAVERHEADLGVVIDEDHRGCAVVDDEGELVPPAVVGRLLARENFTATESPVRFWSEQPAASGLVLGCENRFAFPGLQPRCDAFVTLARLAGVLSCGNATLAEISESETARLDAANSAA